MANTWKRLAGPALVTGSAATKYTAPAAGAIIRHIRVGNPGSGSPLGFTLSVGSDAAGTRLYDVYSIPAGGTDFYPIVPLTNAEIVQAFAASTNILTLTINGIDLT